MAGWRHCGGDYGSGGGCGGDDGGGCGDGGSGGDVVGRVMVVVM